jgi:hypothetical protein
MKQLHQILHCCQLQLNPPSCVLRAHRTGRAVPTHYHTTDAPVVGVPAGLALDVGEGQKQAN